MILDDLVATSIKESKLEPVEKVCMALIKEAAWRGYSSIENVLEEINNYQNWDYLIELYNETRRLERAERQQEIDEQKFPCKRCRKLILWKERVDFICPGPDSDYRFGGSYCSDCFPTIKQSYDKAYKRECPVCGEIYYSSQATLCEGCRHDPFLIKERQRISSARKSAIDLGLECTLVLPEWLNILERFNRKCVYCGSGFESLDHVVPLSLGGGTIKENCVPACMDCNIKKGSTVWHYHTG